MAVHDKNPIIKWEQGQGDISNVRIVNFFFWILDIYIPLANQDGRTRMCKSEGRAA
jgi:hypothetical protein